MTRPSDGALLKAGMIRSARATMPRIKPANSLASGGVLLIRCHDPVAIRMRNLQAQLVAHSNIQA